MLELDALAPLAYKFAKVQTFQTICVQLPRPDAHD
jgi:hypothetical protein